MIKICDKDLRCVSNSKNLLGIIEYTRAHAVERVDIWPRKDGEALVGIAWENGSTTTVDFASFVVAKEFFKSRRRFGHPIIHNQPA